jgi:hypothetical protein
MEYLRLQRFCHNGLQKIGIFIAVNILCLTSVYGCGTSERDIINNPSTPSSPEKPKKEVVNWLPAIPEPETNPYVATMYDGLRLSSSTYVGDSKDQDETMAAALAYFHPSSPMKGNEDVLKRLLVLLDGRLSLWDAGKNLTDHMSSFEVTYAYMLLSTYAPDKIPADKKDMWIEAIKKHNAEIIHSFSPVVNDHAIGTMIINMDICRTLSLWIGGLCVNDTVSANLGKNAVENVITKCLMGDGATHYVSYSNEVPGYHLTIVQYATWYYLFTGSEKIKKYLWAMKNYTPLSIHYYKSVSQNTNGFTEATTTPPWKIFMGAYVNYPALITAYLTGDGYNYAIGKYARTLLIYAFLYRSGLQEKALPDNFILYDRNVLGPRARYGKWGIVATTRDPSSPLPEVNETPSPVMCGISTYVGAYCLKDNGQLNAMLLGTAPCVKYKSGDEDDWCRGNKWAFTTGKNSQNRVSKSRHIYGVSGVHSINKRDFNSATGWNGMQQWVITPERVIGMVEMVAGSDVSAYGIAQRIQLASNIRTKSTFGDGKAQYLINTGDSLFEYGDLRLKIYAKDYAGKLSTINRVQHPFGVLDNDGSIMLLLNDRQDDTSDNLISYPAGTKHYVLMETTNKDFGYALQAHRLILPVGLEGFEFEEKGRKIQMIQNVSSQAISYTGKMTTSFTNAGLLSSWMDTGPSILSVKNKVVSLAGVSIPPYEHILIVSSVESGDLDSGYSVYEDVFK